MHILDALFRVSYGGFLQPIQSLLGMKRITKKTTSKCFVFMLVVSRIIFGFFVIFLPIFFNSKFYGDCPLVDFCYTKDCHQSSLDLGRLTNHELVRRAFMDWSCTEQCQVVLGELEQEQADCGEVIQRLEGSFQVWKTGLRESGREVAIFCLQYMEVMEVLELYDFGIKKEKPMLNELLMVEMLPMFSLMGKSR